MNLINSEIKEKNELELTIEVEPEEVEAAVNKAYIKNRNKIAVPGFRKGKAPRKMIEKMYGAEIFLSDALDELIPNALRFVLDETEYRIVGYPKVTDVDMKDDNTRVEITLTAGLYPEVTIGEYKGLSAQKPPVEIPESEIDAEITSLMSRNARFEKAERPAENGDIAVIDFEGFLDGVAFEGGKGENYELSLGSGQFIPGFEEKVEGMSVGDERDIDLVFPEDYKEDLAGKPVLFKVKLNEVKEKILPELDDEFAKDVSEFDTLDEYKADIREKMQETKQQDIDETFENALMEQIVESLEADIPEAMIDEQYEKSLSNLTRQISAYGMQPDQYMQMMGLTPEELKEKMRDNNEKQVKAALALEKIAELENIDVSDAEIDEEYKEASERFGMEIDKIKQSVTNEDIILELKLRKATKLVIDSAVVADFKADKPKKTADKKSDSKKPTAKKPAAKKTDAKKAETEKQKKAEETKK